MISRYPLMAKSRWVEDVFGQHVAAATLSPEVIATAQERGKALDLNTAAAALIEELA